MITLCIENPRDSTHKKKKKNLKTNLAKLKDTESTHKNQLCFYTNNDQSEKEVKKIILFMRASKRIKYLAINLTKEAKDLYTETTKLKELLKEDANK